MEVKYSSWIRNAVGEQKEFFALPSGIQTVAEFTDWLSQKERKYTSLFEKKSIIHVAVNGRIVQNWDSCLLKDSDELNFFSALAGG